MLGNLHDMITPAAFSLCVCLCLSVSDGEREEKNCSGTGFSGKMVLNICELDDTHLKQREGRCVGGSD